MNIECLYELLKSGKHDDEELSNITGLSKYAATRIRQGYDKYAKDTTRNFVYDVGNIAVMPEEAQELLVHYGLLSKSSVKCLTDALNKGIIKISKEALSLKRLNSATWEIRDFTLEELNTFLGRMYTRIDIKRDEEEGVQL